MDEPIRSRTSTIDIYIKLAQYPILAEEIRARMRKEIFRRGVIAHEDFEILVKKKAAESQKREGLFDPFAQELASQRLHGCPSNAVLLAALVEDGFA